MLCNRDAETIISKTHIQATYLAYTEMMTLYIKALKRIYEHDHYNAKTQCEHFILLAQKQLHEDNRQFVLKLFYEICKPDPNLVFAKLVFSELKNLELQQNQ